MSFLPENNNDSPSVFKNILMGGLLGAMTNGKFMYPGLALMTGQNPFPWMNNDNNDNNHEWDGHPRGLGRRGWGMPQNNQAMPQQQMGQNYPWVPGQQQRGGMM